MTLTIVALNNKEEFLQFLDTDLCSVTETIDYQGLRTIEFKYTFQDPVKDKRLFQQGNKIWIQGDRNLKDCLYVINTEVTEDIYKENQFSFNAEEVLVELNYAPLFSHTELNAVATDGQTPPNTFNVFKKAVTNGKEEVYITWNALNYWFGDYFNIGVVQDCISTYASRISLSGTMTRMSLLRYIEQETGNVFVTRYVKDELNNTIHRYLDFLNPININKNWTLYTEYTFIDNDVLSVCYDENGNVIDEEYGWQAVPMWDTDYENMTPDQVDTTIPTENPTESTYDYVKEAEELLDPSKDYTPLRDIDPTNIVFRIVTEDELQLLADDETTELKWTAEDVGFNDDVPNAVIRLIRKGRVIAIEINNKSFVINSNTQTENISTGFIQISDDEELQHPYTATIPDDSYFEIYDTEAEKVIYRIMINNQLGSIHKDILDFGFNVENVYYNVDESETFSAVSPLLQLSESNNSGLSRTQLGSLISSWKNLSIKKGDVVPYIVEKVTKTAQTLASATSSFGTYNLRTNYFTRPLNPNDNTDQGLQKTFEFYQAIGYWQAPYTKKAGSLNIITGKDTGVSYNTISDRPDTRNEKGMVSTFKMGTTECDTENVYLIYRELCEYLREHETPNIDVQVDVANLKNGKYINYDLHDKVYIKLPDSDEIVTARVVSTSKEAHDVSKNTITLSNYVSKNTIKTIPKSTFILCNNQSIRYPSVRNIVATLVNEEYDSGDPESQYYLPVQLLTYSLYVLNNGSRTFVKSYTKVTDSNGQTKLPLRLNPGNYEIDIRYGGDEYYLETISTIKVNVSGVKETPAKMTPRPKVTSTDNNKAKTTAKTTTKTKTVTTYWTKCGLAPNSKVKRIISIAQPSAGDGGYSYNQLYKTQFYNRCPECGKIGTLRFDGGKWNACISSSTYGHPWKDDVPEHEITCIACDSDFDGVTGLEKDTGHSTRLKRLTKPVKSDKSEFARLVSGKLVYLSKKVTVKDTAKNTTNQRGTRKYRASLSSKIKKTAESIVGNKIGIFAAKAIAEWMDRNIGYSRYYGFCRKPETVLSMGSVICCDGTRLFFALCDGVGCCEHLDLYYIYVVGPTGHIYGKVVTRKTGSYRFVDTASDSHEAWGYVCMNYPRSTSPASKYPNIPFECG